jgi:hypothetical protein
VRIIEDSSFEKYRLKYFFGNIFRQFSSYLNFLVKFEQAIVYHF